MQVETSKQSTTDGLANSREMDQLNVHAFDEDTESKLGLFCRICLEFHGKANDDLISPCMCKGTQRFVHRLCLDRWRSQKEGFSFSHCPTCKSEFLEYAQCDFTFKLFVAREPESIRQVLDLRQGFKGREMLQRRMLAHIYNKYKINMHGLRKEEILDFHPSYWDLTGYYDMHSLLEKSYLFKGVSQDLILQLASMMRPVRYFGRFVVKDEAPSHFYIVLGGSVNLYEESCKRDDFICNVATKGDMIGEVTTICGMPQYFSAQPVRNFCLVSKIDRATLFELVQDRLPDGAMIMNNISQQIKKDILMLPLRKKIEEMNTLNRTETNMVTLHFAALGGNYSLMHQLLEGDSDPNDSDEKGRTALHIAASKGSEKCVHLLLDYGANPNSKDQEGNIPLWEAILGSHELVINLLMRHGADISSGDVGTYTNFAVHHKNLSLLEQIVQYGGDINLPSLIDSKITSVWVEQQTITREGGFLDLLYKMVTFDYVGGADDEKFFGSASLAAADFPYSLLTKKKGSYRHRTSQHSSSSCTIVKHATRNVEGGSSSCGHAPRDHSYSRKLALSCPHKGGCCALIHHPHPRVILSCPEKNENSFMVLLPDSFKELLEIALKKFRIFPCDIVVTTENGARIDCLEVIRDGDSLVIVPEVK